MKKTAKAKPKRATAPPTSSEETWSAIGDLARSIRKLGGKHTDAKTAAKLDSIERLSEAALTRNHCDVCGRYCGAQLTCDICS